MFERKRFFWSEKRNIFSKEADINNPDSVIDGFDDSYAIFDVLEITDTRIPELCSRAGQPTPFLLLQECLRRRSTCENTEITTKIRRIRHERHEFTLKVAENSVKVTCVNKQEGKQMASQKMLNLFYPDVSVRSTKVRLEKSFVFWFSEKLWLHFAWIRTRLTLKTKIDTKS